MPAEGQPPERLRQAADAADAMPIIRYAPDGRSLRVSSRVAALLRAVADDVEIGLYIVGAESPSAAVALADAILGGEE